MDEGSPVDKIYFDFQKAFDKVPHHRLILKLKSRGIGIIITHWIEQWLSDRRQRVGPIGIIIIHWIEQWLSDRRQRV